MTNASERIYTIMYNRKELGEYIKPGEIVLVTFKDDREYRSDWKGQPVTPINTRFLETFEDCLTLKEAKALRKEAEEEAHSEALAAGAIDPVDEADVMSKEEGERWLAIIRDDEEAEEYEEYGLDFAT